MEQRPVIRFREQLLVNRGFLLLKFFYLLKITLRRLGLSKYYHAALIKQINTTELFDPAYYLETNNDVAESGISPVRHYVLYGDKEGRNPCVLFDPDYYRAHVKHKGSELKTNTLLHYAFIGRYIKLPPSPWFDLDYYLSTNKDVFRSGLDPLYHYLHYGGQEGRFPCPHFDSAYYLSQNPSIKEARLNPLTHYLLYGRFEGQSALPPKDEHGIKAEQNPLNIQKCTLLAAVSEGELIPRANISNATIDVIVPAYRGRTETLNCIYSVLTSENAHPFELIVINDNSPEQELVTDLERIASEGLFTLINNIKNLGFVKTANQGMQLHSDRDIVLLNSDTEVYNNWLDRLADAAHRDDKTSTVTPLSNNATICSYPRSLHDNPYPLETPYAELDQLTAQVNQNVEIEVPTGVGFCMYIKRTCINEIGLFNEEAFGRGYGEENDFCQRAIENGWRNIIAADVFVRHWGGSSFQGEKAKRVRDALKTMDRHHPNFQRDVHEFIRVDPVKLCRQRLDRARLKRLKKEKNILIVCHNRGGGTERHVSEDIKSLTELGYGVFIMRPIVGSSQSVTISFERARSFPNLPIFELTQTTELAEFLNDLDINEIHTHSLVDFCEDAPEHIAKLVEHASLYWEVNIHDYKVICPRINLADQSGFYCGEPSQKVCNKCLVNHGSEFKETNISAWRKRHYIILNKANKILVPDIDVTHRLNRYFPNLHFEVSPHEDNDIDLSSSHVPEKSGKEKIRVAVIGAISKIKGYNVLLACAKEANKHKLPIEFVVMGYTLNDRPLTQVGVEITGKYVDMDAVKVLDSIDADIVWLPSTWPETYSYTLSIALKSGHPVAAFDIGAISSRLKDLKQTDFLMPLRLAKQPKAVNRFFLKRLESTIKPV